MYKCSHTFLSHDNQCEYFSFLVCVILSLSLWFLLHVIDMIIIDVHLCLRLIRLVLSYANRKSKEVILFVVDGEDQRIGWQISDQISRDNDILSDWKIVIRKHQIFSSPKGREREQIQSVVFSLSRLIGMLMCFCVTISF